MDAVVDPRMAGELARLGGLAVLNLEGVQARYDDPDAVLARIAAAPDGEVQDLLAEVYQQPIREDLIAARLEAIHAAGSKAAVAATPGAARRFGPFCAEHGADLFLVQSQVSSARHLATDYDPLSLEEFTRYMPIPVAVGNTTNAEAAFQLMEQGAAAVFVGVGPGAACTTREVLGIGVPQVTAISDVAAARDAYERETGRYVPVVADGGMRRGGELAKAIAAGADALMIGSPLAKAEEAPGRGTNWGMAAPSPTLPRGHPHQGRDDRHARAHPARAGPRDRRQREPRRGAAPVDGRARRADDPRDAGASRWSTLPRPRPRASPGNGLADRGTPMRPGRARRSLRRIASFAVVAALLSALVVPTAVRAADTGPRPRSRRRHHRWLRRRVGSRRTTSWPTCTRRAGRTSRPLEAVRALRLRHRDDVRLRRDRDELAHPAQRRGQLRQARDQRQARRWLLRQRRHAARLRVHRRHRLGGVVSRSALGDWGLNVHAEVIPITMSATSAVANRLLP